MCINKLEIHESNSFGDKDVELSIVMPCYNEEEVLPISIPPLLKLCNKLNLRHEVILVNNGSSDGTPQIIDSFISQGYPVRRVDVLVNQGYGWGIICGLKEAVGEYIAYMCSDGQVLAEDVVRTFLAIRNTQRGTLAKVRRVSRGDGLLRKSVSWVFNLLFLILYGAITTDVNATPKIFHKEDLNFLKPTSKNSFIDLEIMVKCKILGFNILEIPVDFYERQGGSSTVRILSKSFEFLKNIFRFRWSKELEDWKKQIGKTNENI